MSVLSNTVKAGLLTSRSVSPRGGRYRFGKAARRHLAPERRLPPGAGRVYGRAMFRVVTRTADRSIRERRSHLVWEGSLGQSQDGVTEKFRPEGTPWSDLPDLADAANDLWPDAEHVPSLWERLIREGSNSDVWTSGTPEEWSPLGQCSYSSFGALMAEAATADQVTVSRGGEPSPIFFEERAGVQMLGLISQDELVGGLSITPFAFIVPVDAGTVEIELELLEDSVIEDDLKERRTELQLLGVAEPPELALMWRLYRGTNSSAVDGQESAPEPTFRIVPGVIAAGAYLVGRLVVTVNGHVRRDDRDPFFRGRVAHAEVADLKIGRRTVEECPELEVVAKGGGVGSAAIVAVHGTMACAIPLARELSAIFAGRGPILRFEHDTWHGIHVNGTALAKDIRSAGIRDVLFVAHSRGGLVARQAMANLRDEAPETTCRLIAVGTPFAGTPVVAAVESGMLGMRAALGVIRVLTGPAIDTVSRLLGMLIKGRLPLGIAQMHPAEGYLAAFAGTQLPITAIAGYVDPNGPADSWGVAAQRGLGDAVFRDPETSSPMRHDYVVPTSSAASRVDPTALLEVECDHSSYFVHPEVRAYLAADPWSPPVDPSAERHTW